MEKTVRDTIKEIIRKHLKKNKPVSVIKPDPKIPIAVLTYHFLKFSFL